ncbi:hypothetical protein [Catenulispora sp. GAS73]|uniref:hypothetical protein n=1 Tax=Catenulispora sp. GAS73 TaxID=3156269 RepID=UPI003518E783
MRELLSGALPAPQDEPPQRDVIDSAMDWGARRRRRDWTLTGAAALAVVALATGVAALSGGGGSRGGTATPGGQAPTSVSTHRSMGGVPSQPAGSSQTQQCQSPGDLKGSLADFCKVFNEQRNFNADFAKGSVPFIQAALPPGFTVRATSTWVVILTGPDGTTNYLFPSTGQISTLNGERPGCGTPAPAGCLQTSTAGGSVVVNSEPSGQQSAGYVGDFPDDPRLDILVGTSVSGAMNGIAPPTAKVSLLSDTQLAKIMSDPQLLQYAKLQLNYAKALSRQLAAMLEPSSSGSYSPPPGSAPPSGVPSSPPLGWQSSPGDPSWHSVSGGQSSSSLPPGESYSTDPAGGPHSGPGSTHSQPSGTQSSSGS